MTLGKNLSRVRLLELARTVSQQKGIVLDRCATRIKDALICWFCENAKEIMPDLLPQPDQSTPPVDTSYSGLNDLSLGEEIPWDFDSEDAI
jgi:hypothetical protein